MDPLTRCARIPVDLTMSGRSEVMKMFHVSYLFFFFVLIKNQIPETPYSGFMLKDFQNKVLYPAEPRHGGLQEEGDSSSVHPPHGSQ
jgi:hypothetical protein